MDAPPFVFLHSLILAASYKFNSLPSSTKQYFPPSTIMNSIRQIQELNKRELELGISPNASWHADYRDTAYIYIGGLPFDLSEGDVITIFSQYGEPTFVHLVRDKETGKSKGFAFLKYEDQRSTDLAVDNLGGAVIMGRTLRVDHTRYKKKDEEEGAGVESNDIALPARASVDPEEAEPEEKRPMIKEELELAKLIREHDEEDPMKAFLIEEKKEEVAKALAKLDGHKQHRSERKKHSSSRSHRHRGEDEEGRHSSTRHSRRRSRSRDRRSPESPDGKRGDRSRRRRYESGSRSRSPDRDRSSRHRHDDRSSRYKGDPSRDSRSRRDR